MHNALGMQIGALVWVIGIALLFFRATRWKVLQWSAVFWVGLIANLTFAEFLKPLGYVMVWGWIAVLVVLPVYWVVRAVRERDEAETWTP